MSAAPRPPVKTLDPKLRRSPGPAPTPAAALPSHDFPVVLFPVRVETRFVDKQLLVRIYPDQLAVETHEHELTADEVIAGREFRKRFDSGGDQDKRGAFRDLARHFGPLRAAWIARQIDGYDGKDAQQLGRDSWTTAPTVRVLPDRFLVTIYRKGVRVPEYDTLSSSPVPRELGIVRAPTETKDGDGAKEGEKPGLFDAAAKWVSNFDEAVAKGMGVKINLREKDPPPFSHVIAVGLNAAVKPADAARMLEEILDGHHYKSGLGFLPYGTPTNNTAKAKSGHSDSDEDLDHAYDVELGAAEALDDRTAAQRLRRALGLPAATQIFAHVEHAADKQDSYAQEMQSLLWPATGGHFLEKMLEGVVPKDEIGRAREHFIRYVRGRGPLPCLRIGNLPYGFLPVTRLLRARDGDADGWKERADDSVKLAGDPDKWSEFDSRLHSFGEKLRSLWLARAERAELVPRMGQGDADAELLAVLGMEPRSLSYRLQPYVDERFVGVLLVALRNRFFGKSGKPEKGASEWVDHWKESSGRASDLLAKLGADAKAARAARLVQAIAWGEGEAAEAKLLGDDPAPYLSAFCEKGKDAQPASNALFAKLVHCAFQLDADPGRVREIVCGLLGKPGIDFLNQAKTAEQLATHLQLEAKRRDGLRASANGSSRQMASKVLAAREALPGKKFATAAQAAGVLGVDPAALYAMDLDGLLRDGLDLLSHRLDAWMTSFAAKRLDAMRERVAEGVHLGAYGWVEDLQPAGANAKSGEGETAVAPGYIHAPSLNQASAAAVMRSVFLHHERGGTSNPFRIDLTSDRVRRALQLLDGVREGQPLSALLGYQFERALHDSALDRYIDQFRGEFPLVAHKETPAQQGETSETVAARNVVDGLDLARAEKGRLDKALQGAGDRKTIEAHIEGLRDALDATGDLLMTEAIFQSIRGNFERASAALEAAAGKGPPPEIDSIVTPTSGVSLRHRVCAVFPATAPRAGAGAKAAAEPHLDAWFGSLVGDLNTIGCSAAFGAAAVVTVLLGKRPDGAADGIWLGLDPIDFLYMAALPPSGEETQLDARVKFHVRAAKALAPDAPVHLDHGRSGVRSLGEAAELARAVLALIGSARPLDPDGLCRREDAPADSFAKVKLDELRARVDTARAALQASVVDALADGRSDADAVAGLLAADLFGIQGAMPSAPADAFQPVSEADKKVLAGHKADLARRRAAVTTEAKKRLATSQKLLDGSASRSNEDRVDACIDAMKALFGKGFAVLPQFEPIDAAGLSKALSQNGRLEDDPEDRVMLWLQQVAETHPAVRRLESALMVEQAWGTPAGTVPLRMRVAQLPYCEQRPWQALSDAEIAALRGDAKDATGDCADPPKGRPRGVTSIVALAPAADSPDLGCVAGLAIDDWSETVPLAEVTTGLALQYDAPGSQAPQAVLLAVPARKGDGWTPHQLRDIVRDTADLVRMRLVDPDALGEIDETPGGEAADAAPAAQGKLVHKQAAPAARGKAGGRDLDVIVDDDAQAAGNGPATHHASEHHGPTPVGALLPALFMPMDPKQPEPKPDAALPTLHQWQEKLKKS